MKVENTKDKEEHLEIREMMAQRKHFLQRNWEKKIE